jgi:hypothetical protein
MVHMQNCDRRARPQFSLLALFEHMTLCCILAALAGFTGVAPALCLMGLALALTLRQGVVALAMLMATAITAGGARPQLATMTATIIAAAAVCGWYQFRSRRLMTRIAPAAATHQSAGTLAGQPTPVQEF